MPTLRDFDTLIQQHPDASDEELLQMMGAPAVGTSAPSAPSAVSRAWEWGNAPLVDLADDTFGDSGVGRFGTSLVESMTSPLSLASLALSGGASLAGKAGLLGLSRGARGAEAALNLPYIAEGLSTMAGAKDWGEVAGGGLEAALGSWGLKGALGRPTSSGRSLADDVSHSRILNEERGSLPLGGIGEPDLPYEEILARTTNPKIGGSSTFLSGASPEGGVMVGGVVPPLAGAEATPEALARFAMEHRAALEAAPNRTFGTWMDPNNGMVDLDISENVPELTDALALARQRGEKAVFDLGTFQNVPNPAHPDTEKFWQELRHRSPLRGLTQLDPEFQATGTTGSSALSDSVAPAAFAVGAGLADEEGEELSPLQLALLSAAGVGAGAIAAKRNMGQFQGINFAKRWPDLQSMLTQRGRFIKPVERRIEKSLEVGSALPADWADTDYLSRVFPTGEHARQFMLGKAALSPSTQVGRNLLDTIGAWAAVQRAGKEAFTPDALAAGIGGDRIGFVGAKYPNFMRALNGEPFSDSSFKTFAYGNLLAGKGDELGHFPVDSQFLDGIGAWTDKSPSSWPQYKTLVDAAMPIYKSFAPEAPISRAFPTSWEGFRAIKGEPYFGGVPDMIKQLRLDEPGFPIMNPDLLTANYPFYKALLYPESDAAKALAKQMGVGSVADLRDLLIRP
jgi:hypothetical protein